MRVIGSVPHELVKITIFEWNNRYLIKLELGQFEQTYKVNQTDVSGLAGVQKLVDEAFIAEAIKNFVEMRSAFSETYKRNNQ